MFSNPGFGGESKVIDAHSRWARVVPHDGLSRLIHFHISIDPPTGGFATAPPVNDSWHVRREEGCHDSRLVGSGGVPQAKPATPSSSPASATKLFGRAGSEDDQLSYRLSLRGGSREPTRPRHVIDGNADAGFAGASGCYRRIPRKGRGAVDVERKDVWPARDVAVGRPPSTGQVP